MNDKYLRKKKLGVRLLQHSLPRMLRRGAIWKIGIIVVILGYVVLGNRGVLQRVNLELEKQKMIERVEEAEKETEVLNKQLERVSNDNEFIETIARERHGMIRTGETVYRIAEE